MTISTCDFAHVMAIELIRIIQTHLRPEDRQEAYNELFDEFFDVCMGGLLANDKHADKIHGRLKPSRN